MTGSQREDSLLRQIRAVAAMLAHMVGLRMSGQGEEAQQQPGAQGGHDLGRRSE